MKKIYSVLGMSCQSCEEKIKSTLEEFSQIDYTLNFEKSEVEISTNDISFDIEEINNALKIKGNYFLQDPDKKQNMDFIPPEERISPSSVYFCPMLCQGEKVYFKPGQRCPECNMFLVPIEEKEKYQNIASSPKSMAPNSQNEGKFYCPMFCEGEKLYDSNVGCKVCGMDLVMISNGNSKNSTLSPDKELYKKLIFSIIFAIPVFVLSMGGMWFNWGIEAKYQGIIEFLLHLPIVFYSGRFLLERGFNSFKTRNLNMFSLIFVGVISAEIFSIFALFFPEIFPKEFYSHGRISLYFESVAIILTLVILGQYLEAKAHQKTSQSIKELMQLSPETAVLMVGNEEKTIPVQQIQKGNLLKVKAGEKIPTDGEIFQGETFIDASMITGEALPESKKKGDKVFAGTINTDGVFIMKAEKINTQTLLSQIIEMVNHATRSKAPVQKLVDKISKIFVPAVIFSSVLTFVAWYFLGGENKLIYALANSISVLIVACPCALGLATPMSLMVGIGKGAKNGILIKNALVLEQMNQINTLVVDKTGTLTQGKPIVSEEFYNENFSKKEILYLMASLCQNSTHPLSQAVVHFFQKEEKNHFKEVKNFKNISGKGITGEMEGKKYFFGNFDFIKTQISKVDSIFIEKNKNLNQTTSFFSDENEILAYFSFSDEIKKEASEAIKFFQKSGIEIIMMTGDLEKTAQEVAEKLQIPKYFSRCLPENKLLKIKEIQEKGGKVAMAGDGINDAPALAQADISIAMGTGSAVAIENSSITLLNGNISGIVKSKILSQKLMQNIKENLFFAFIYNIIGIPVAMGILYPIFGILLSPMLAALAMSFSSLSVILNSLRLNKTSLDF